MIKRDEFIDLCDMVEKSNQSMSKFAWFAEEFENGKTKDAKRFNELESVMLSDLVDLMSFASKMFAEFEKRIGPKDQSEIH